MDFLPLSVYLFPQDSISSLLAASTSSGGKPADPPLAVEPPPSLREDQVGAEHEHEHQASQHAEECAAPSSPAIVAAVAIASPVPLMEPHPAQPDVVDHAADAAAEDEVVPPRATPDPRAPDVGSTSPRKPRPASPQPSVSLPAMVPTSQPCTPEVLQKPPVLSPLPQSQLPQEQAAEDSAQPRDTFIDDLMSTAPASSTLQVLADMSSPPKRPHSAPPSTSGEALSPPPAKIARVAPAHRTLAKPSAVFGWDAAVSGKTSSESSSSSSSSSDDDDGSSSAASSASGKPSVLGSAPPSPLVAVAAQVAQLPRQRYDTHAPHAVAEPEYMAGTEWWLKPLWPSLAPLLSQLPDDRPLYKTEHLCAGTAPDSMAFNLLHHVINHKCIAVAEKKRAAQTFIKSTFGSEVGILFNDNAAFISGRGKDALRGNKESVLPKERAHCASAGLPCQPWTKSRSHSGESNRTSTPSRHPDYNTTMVQWPLYLKTRRPGCWFVEEVPDMEAYQTPDVDDTIDADQTDLWRFALSCCHEGYAVRTFEADHGLFAKIPRHRTPAALHIASIGWVFVAWFLGRPGPPMPRTSTSSGRPNNHVLKPTCRV